MIMLYSILWKIQVVQKGRFVRENLRSGRTRNLRQEPHDFVGGLLKIRVVLPEKTKAPCKRPDLCKYMRCDFFLGHIHFSNMQHNT